MRRLRRRSRSLLVLVFGSLTAAAGMGAAPASASGAAPGAAQGIVQITARASPYTYVAEPLSGGPNQPFYTLPDQVALARDMMGFSEPALSPDGHRYAYNDPQGFNGTPDIKVGTVGGVAATHLGALSGKTVDVSVPPAWSPDGLDLAVLVDSTQLYEEDLYIVRADGSAAKKVASEVLAVDVAWSPDGNKVSFVRDPNVIHDGPSTLATVDLRTGQVARLWSPLPYSSFENTVWASNATLLFSRATSNQQTAFRIERVPARGGAPRPLPSAATLPHPLLGVAANGQLVTTDDRGEVLVLGSDGRLVARLPTSSQEAVLQWIPGRLAAVSSFDRSWNTPGGS